MNYPDFPPHPAGQTCVDCVFFQPTCSWLLSYSGRETTCDWAPSRFRPLPAGALPPLTFDPKKGCYVDDLGRHYFDEHGDPVG